MSQLGALHPLLLSVIVDMWLRSMPQRDSIVGLASIHRPMRACVLRDGFSTVPVRFWLVVPGFWCEGVKGHRTLLSVVSRVPWGCAGVAAGVVRPLLGRVGR